METWVVGSENGGFLGRLPWTVRSGVSRLNTRKDKSVSQLLRATRGRRQPTQPDIASSMRRIPSCGSYTQARVAPRAECALLSKVSTSGRETRSVVLEMQAALWQSGRALAKWSA